MAENDKGSKAAASTFKLPPGKWMLNMAVTCTVDGKTTTLMPGQPIPEGLDAAELENLWVRQLVDRMPEAPVAKNLAAAVTAQGAAPAPAHPAYPRARG